MRRGQFVVLRLRVLRPMEPGFKEKVLGKAGRVQLEFQSGQNVTFIVPENQGGLLTELVQDESMHMKNLQVVFGDLITVLLTINTRRC